MGTTLLLFGHDDLVLATDFMDGTIENAADWITNHSDVVFDGPLPTTAPLADEDLTGRLSHSLIEGASQLASAPTDAIQDVLGLDGSGDLAEDNISNGVSSCSHRDTMSTYPD